MWHANCSNTDRQAAELNLATTLSEADIQFYRRLQSGIAIETLAADRRHPTKSTFQPVKVCSK